MATKDAKPKYASIEDYIAAQSGPIGDRLRAICGIVAKIAPKAEGRISYDMPAFFYKGRLLYFAAFKKHVGFFPASMAVFDEFSAELEGYEQSGRGTIRFPHDAALPLDLIAKIVAFRARQNEARDSAEGGG